MTAILAAPSGRVTQVLNKMKASLDEGQTDIVQFTQREFRSVENIAHVSATQNAIPLIFQCHGPATIFIPNIIAEAALKVVPSGHHLKVILSDSERISGAGTGRLSL